jgi:hypothetical protein
VAYDKPDDKYDAFPAQDSMSKLIGQERETGDLLTPSIWPTLKKRFKQMRSSSESSEFSAQSSDQLKQLGRSSLVGLGKFAQFLQKLLTQLVLAIGAGIKALVNLIRQRQSSTHGNRRPLSGVQYWWQRISLPRRILLVVFVGVVLFFWITVGMKGKNVQEETQVANWDKTITEINNLLGEVESKKIIADETGARTSLGKAETLLNTIPKDSETYKQQGQTLQDKINTYNNTFNKVTPLTGLIALGNFTTANAAAQVANIAKIGENIYGFDQASNSIYRLSLADNSVTTTITGNSATAAFTTVENDSSATTLAALSTNDFVQFNPILEKASPVTTAKLPTNVAIADIDLFSNRLYILDPANKQIYRQQKNGEQYIGLTNWVKDTKVDLSTAVAFDIDASIYVLMQSGEIIKLDNGTKANFTADTFTPSLAGSTRLIKETPDSNFYIVNPATQRIVELTSAGKLSRQFTAPEFAQLNDIVVDEANSTMYVLAGNQVFKVALE